MSIGSFSLVRNEILWIGPHLANWLPHLDEMCFFDGNSTDGTLELIKHFRECHPDGRKITLVERKDPENLQDDYVRLFNQCLRTLSTDMAIFLHPDMISTNPQAIKKVNGTAYYTNIRSFAGNPGGKLFEIKGRGKKWKNIYRLRNPDLGAHYFGHYGATNEDVYFSEITGTEHRYFQAFDRYPYDILDSGVHCLHFSDVRPYERRLDRMIKCLRNQGYTDTWAADNAPKHPRVSLEDGMGMEFQPTEYPEIFKTWRESFKKCGIGAAA